MEDSTDFDGTPLRWARILFLGWVALIVFIFVYYGVRLLNP